MGQSLGTVSFSNKNSKNKKLYIADDVLKNQGWCACLLLKPLEESIDLPTTWKIENNAVYLYAAIAPKDETNFLKELGTYLESLDPHSNVFLWLNNTELISDTTAYYIITKESLVGQRLTNNNANILFAKYVNISVSELCLVTLPSDGLYFKIEEQSGTIRFSNKLNTSDSHIDDDTLYISMLGPSRGCIRFGLNFNGATDWKAYDTGLKYFYKDKSVLKTMHFPLLDSSFKPRIDFQASLDPNNQLNHTSLRTFLAFDTADTIFPTYLRSDVGNPIFLSAHINFEPDENELPYKMPSTNASLLVFSSTDKANKDAGYLLMEGAFHLGISDTIPDASETINLLCGLSGLETISFDPQTKVYKGDLLVFVTKQAAFAPLFPPVDGQDYTDEELLNDLYLGAWVSVIKYNELPDIDIEESSIRYVSQPVGSSLYAPTAISSETSTPFLGFYEPVTAYLQQKGTTVFFPMAFYGAFECVVQDDTNIADFENKTLSISRKTVIENKVLPTQIAQRAARKLKKNPADETYTLSTTPQGLLLYQIEGSNFWERLILAKNYKGASKNQTPEEILSLEFLKVNARLQSAFQTNQQFLVVGLDKPLIEEPTETILGDFKNAIQLEGWPFILDVPTSNTFGQFNNILIFKFCDGNVYDRVQNPDQWTNANDFNETSQNGINQISAWLTTYIEEGIEKGSDPVKPDPDFVGFAEKVQDPNWNGILALKTNIDLANFPPELQGLLAGIDLSKFNAHHFGINANRVQTSKAAETDEVSIDISDKSSMFGLIYYVDPAFEAYTENIPAYKQTLGFDPKSNFDFKTLMLKVLFENSKIKSFKSFIQLSIYELFSNAVTFTPDRDNILILTGSYEDHNGSPSYTFNGFGDDRIPVKNPVFGVVEVLRSNFSTLVPTAEEKSEQLIFAEFALWGYLNFSNPEKMDALSFGSVDDINTGDGLAFSQLLVKMNFSLETPTLKTFTFDISEVSFDIATSKPRPESLYNHFPIKLTKLTSGDEDNLPSNQNFIAVTTPDIDKSGAPSGKWYGLVYDINLGTPGALAGSAGFKSSMLIAWSVDSGAVFTGLSLPGLSSQSKLLSLQGVLKLNIASIKLQMAKIDEQSGSATAFLLMMKNISLKFLSKEFPSGGNIDFYVFGDPNNESKPSSVAWYASYQKKDQKALLKEATKAQVGKQYKTKK